MKLEELSSYEILEKKEVGDVNSTGVLLRHKKTGARIVLLSNEDENKVFYIGFRTPPVDSTGVPHILEHSVLCGSRDFPVKDPFVELVKGSLNTFLNAMTYPDKTVYPVASCNDKDFQNLMHVYLDAVFYPNIYKEENIFRQEGWHYEMESLEDELSLNGVVYNEMKGAFSSPDDVLEREIMNSLYPDTPYGVESGGDPEVIPTLSYEEFKEFHGKYYHPANAYIYLYGNMDMAEKLAYIDEAYLSHFDALEVDSQIPVQKPFSEVNRVVKDYPIQEDEEETDNTYLSCNFSVGSSLDKELYVALQVLDYVLCSAPGAPLKQTLIDKGIGKDVYSTYENGILQPYFSVIAKNANAGQEEEFLSTIENVLRESVEKGLDRKSLAAAISYYEFKYREADYGSYPKGLMYGLSMLDSWLYDENRPFIHVEENETFAALKAKAEEGYFEELIRKYLLENGHKSVVILLPKQGMTQENDARLREQLKQYKETLSQEEQEKIVAETKALNAYQEAPDTPEDLSKIPLLSIQDMKKEANLPVNEVRWCQDTKVLYHKVFTNGIGYLRFVFKLDAVPADLFPYISLLKAVFGLMNTEQYSYKELFDEMNIYTGGMAAVTNAYANLTNQEDYTATFEIKTKVLYENLPKAFELAEEMIRTTNYRDTKRLYEILAEAKSRLQAQMMNAGHSLAAGMALSCISVPIAVNDVLNGMQMYRLIEQAESQYEEQKQELPEKLIQLSQMIFRPENLMIDLVSEESAYAKVETLTEGFKKVLFTQPVEKAEQKYMPVPAVNTGYKTSAQIQYVCRAGNFLKKGLPYHGALRVLKVMLGYEYLWLNVRVKGGAYGCMCSFSKTGDSYFTSYRDPNLEKTIQVYEAAADYIAHAQIDERALTQYIIGAVSELDTPMNPAAKGLYSLSAYMTGLTDEMLEKERKELLGTNEEVLRKMAEYVRAFVADQCLCVVGNAENIKNAGGLFEKEENLFLNF